MLWETYFSSFADMKTRKRSAVKHCSPSLSLDRIVKSLWRSVDLSVTDTATLEELSQLVQNPNTFYLAVPDSNYLAVPGSNFKTALALAAQKSSLYLSELVRRCFFKVVWWNYSYLASSVPWPVQWVWQPCRSSRRAWNALQLTAPVGVCSSLFPWLTEWCWWLLCLLHPRSAPIWLGEWCLWCSGSFLPKPGPLPFYLSSRKPPVAHNSLLSASHRSSWNRCCVNLQSCGVHDLQRYNRQRQSNIQYKVHPPHVLEILVASNGHSECPLQITETYIFHHNILGLSLKLNHWQNLLE